VRDALRYEGRIVLILTRETIDKHGATADS